MARGWRLAPIVDGADGNYNSGLEQPEHEPNCIACGIACGNHTCSSGFCAYCCDSVVLGHCDCTPDANATSNDYEEQNPSDPESEPEEQIHNHPQPEVDEELELDESEDDDPMFVGAVAAKMVRGELQLLIRWEAGDNHTRHTIAVFGMTVHIGVQVIALGKHTKANGLSAHMKTCLLTPSPQMLASPFGRPIANHVPESWCPLMLGCMPYNLERFQKFMTCWI